MNTAQLYCQGACAACSTLARSLTDAEVDLRPAGRGRVELVVAQPTGIVEVDEGILDTADDGLEIRLVSRCVGLTSSAKEVTSVERTFDLDGGVLRTTFVMAAVGHRLTHHLASELRRDRATSEGEQS